MRKSVPFAVVASVILLATTACASTADAPSNSAPTSTPIAPGDIDAETQAYLDANAEAMAAQWGISDPPDVQPIRLITLNEWAPTQIACLNEAGFDATFTDDGQGVLYPQLTDPALQASLKLAIYTCELKYPTQERYMTPLSAEGLKALYVYRSGELLDCLKAQGYEDPSEPPSETVFIQSNGEWTPFAEISIAKADLKRVYDACPQTPDSVYGS